MIGRECVREGERVCVCLRVCVRESVWCAVCLLNSHPHLLLHRYLWDGLHVLSVVLVSMEEGQVRWPSEEEMHQWAAMVERRQPALKGCWGFVDGLNIAIQEPSDPLIQNAYYNGWLGGCYCSQLFVFNPLGEIVWAHINAPGSWHDSTLAENLYRKLAVIPHGLSIAADCAFSAQGEADMHIVKPLTKTQLQKHSNDKTVSVQQLVAIIRKHRTAVSIRQAAEWGMGAFQRVWGRMQLPLPGSTKKRRLLLNLAVRLHNARARLVGLNQIRTVYAADYMGPLYETYRHTHFQTVMDDICF